MSLLVVHWYFAVFIKTMHNQRFTKTKQNRSKAQLFKKKVQDLEHGGL